MKFRDPAQREVKDTKRLSSFENRFVIFVTSWFN